MSFLLSLLSGDFLPQLLAVLGVAAAAIGGAFGLRQSGYNAGKRAEHTRQLEDAANATQQRNDVKADVAAASDGDIRQRLRDKWTRRN